MDWTAEIACEGGPVLVANVDDFCGWFGSELYPEDERQELLFYSPFTRELPDKFLVNGEVGHIFLSSEDPAALRDEFVASVLELFPGSKLDRTSDAWLVTRPDGKKLHASLEPSSEYAIAIRNLGHDGVYYWDGGRSCYLWSVDPGLVRVSVRKEHSVLTMSQITFLDENVEETEPYAHAEGAALNELSDARYEITSGAAVVAWSPNSISDLDSQVDISARCQGEPGQLLDLSTGGSGASVWLQPGVYEAHIEYHETRRWGVSWCQLSLAVEHGAAVDVPTASRLGRH